MNVEKLTAASYLEIMDVWEASVRATHNFLQEQDINDLKPLILEQYLDLVELFGVRSESNKLVGFLGVSSETIEMLFVLPSYFSQGIGTLLVRHAIEKLASTKVDVNEQNPKALGFYQSIGFNTIGRSELDGQGRPFPIIHMSL